MNLQVENFQRCERAPVCQLLYCTTVLFKVLQCKIKNVFFIFCVFLMYYLCEKYYKPITVQYYIADCVSWVPRLTLLDLTNKLDLQTRSRNGTRSYVGDLPYWLPKKTRPRQSQKGSSYRSARNQRAQVRWLPSTCP